MSTAKQPTLGKFWEMPKGSAPGARPRDQPSLEATLVRRTAGVEEVNGHASGSGGGGSGAVEGEGAVKDEEGKKHNKEETKQEPDTSDHSLKKRSHSPMEPKVENDHEDLRPGIPKVEADSPPKKKIKRSSASPVKARKNGKSPPALEADGETAPDVKMADSNSGSDSEPIRQSGSKSAARSKATKASTANATASSSTSNPFSLSKPKLASTSTATNGKAKSKGKVAIDPDEEEDQGMEAGSSTGGKKEDAAGSEEEDLEEEDLSDGELVKEDKAVASKLAMTLAQDASKISPSKWKPGESVPYSALTDTFDLIDKTTKRNQISTYLTHFLLEVAKSPGKDGGDLLKVVYLCINRLCPDYMGLELGMGESLIMKAIAQTTGRSPAQIKTDLRKVGDLGLVAEQSRGKQKTLFASSRLTVPTVFKTFKDIAQTSGKDSQTRKVGLVCKLLTPCVGSETRFIIRSCEGKLRIGLAEKTLVTALAHAIVLKEIGSKNLPPSQIADRLARGAEMVKQVYSELPNYDLIVPALLANGIDNLKDSCKLSPGVPLKPMLAKPTKAIGEVLDRFEGKEFTCEYKYDGERAQIHLTPEGQIVVFSRNSENMSAKYPDLVESIPKAMNKNVKSFVIDSEAVAYDLATKKLLPFQDLTRRKRKDVRTEDITVRVHVFAFDLLYLNGEPLLDRELKERRQILRDNFHPVEGEFAFAISSDGSSSEQIAEFLDESIKDGCEGLMVKRLTGADATYEPSRRSINWLKLKKDYLSGVGDSCDLVVVGAYYGKGKRTNVYGAFLLACYDPDSETYQTACKIGTGFSEEQLSELYEKLKPLETVMKRSDISADPSKPPDIWFEPQVLFEVLTADLTLSPIYMAAKGIADARGISLRFPRFIRLRDDKNADDATTSDAIAEFYQAQATAHKGGGVGADDY